MTKNKIFTEIKLAMKAGHYRDLTFKEKKIYKNAFKNGYKLAKIHCKKRSPEFYKPRRIIIWNKIENKKIFFATDTAALNYDIAGIRTFLLEVNYIEDIMNKNVEDGELEQFVANRVERSHFGLADAVDYLSGS